MVLEALRVNKLYAKFSKCEFWMKPSIFPSHVVSRDDIYVDLIKD